MKQLWAPWRLSYVTADEPPADGCVLCAKVEADDADKALIVHRAELATVILNLYPYNNGHSMIVPARHVADLTELTPAESLETQSLLVRTIEALRRAMSPDGFNVGLNLGSAAGAGIAQHLHWHVVPRWNGDTNFMPLVAETKVMPQHLQSTLASLQSAFAQ